MKIYSIKKHGYPDKNDKNLVGRIAFIFDGCIVSGWNLEDGNWEANEDVGRTGIFDKNSVKKYVIFDKPIYEY